MPKHCEDNPEHKFYCEHCCTCHTCTDNFMDEQCKKIEQLEQQLKTAQNLAIKNADKLTKIINAISDNANGYPEDTVYNIACIVGLEVG